MTDWKIGDKVRKIGSDEFLGYVSDVNKGHLFKPVTVWLKIHTGNHIHADLPETEVALWLERNKDDRTNTRNDSSHGAEVTDC